MSSSRHNSFNLSRQLAEQINRKQEGSTVGVFKVLSLKVVTYEEPQPGSLVLGCLQGEESDELTKVTAYQNSCNCFPQLLALTEGAVVEIRDYQAVAAGRIQLWRRSQLLVKEEPDRYRFPTLRQTAVETYILGRSDRIVVSEAVKVKDLRPVAVGNICCGCMSKADESSEVCRMCGCAGLFVTLSTVIRVESPDGVSLKGFMEPSALVKLLGVEIGESFDSLLRGDPDLQCLKNIVERQEDIHVVLSQRYQKQGARGDREVNFVVENVLNPAEFTNAVLRSKALKKRK